MKVNIEQLKRMFYLGDEYGPNFIGLHSLEIYKEKELLIVKIRAMVFDVDNKWKKTCLRERVVEIDSNGKILKETYEDLAIEENTDESNKSN